MRKEIQSSPRQEVQRVPYRINPRRNMSEHILIKITEIKHKKRILKTAREMQQVTYKGKPIWLTVDVCQSSAFELLVKISGMDCCLRNRLLLQGRDLRAQEAVEKVVSQLPGNSECQLERGLTSRHHQPRRSPALGWKKMASVNTWLHNRHRAGHC